MKTTFDFPEKWRGRLPTWLAAMSGREQNAWLVLRGWERIGRSNSFLDGQEKKQVTVFTRNAALRVQLARERDD